VPSNNVLYNPVLKLRRILIAALPVAFESCGSLAICFKEWHPMPLIVYGCSEFLMEAVPYLPIKGTEVLF